MSNRRNFNYTYQTDNESNKIASIKDIRFIPYIKFDLVYNNEIIPCHLDYILDEWHLSLPNKYKEAPLSQLNDIFWNYESIYEAIENVDLALAISKAIFEIYREYQNILS